MLIRVQRNNPLPREVTNHFVMFTCTIIYESKKEQNMKLKQIFTVLGKKPSLPHFIYYIIYCELNTVTIYQNRKYKSIFNSRATVNICTIIFTVLIFTSNTCLGYFWC